MIVKHRMAGIGRMYINSIFHCDKYSNIPFSLSMQWLYKAGDLTTSNNVIILQIVLLNNFILHG